MAQPTQIWSQPITVAAQGLDTDVTKQNFGLNPGLYIVQIVSGELEQAKEQGKSPNLLLKIKTTQAGVGEGASPVGSEDSIRVSTSEEDFPKRLRKALAKSVGYPAAEVEQPTFQLAPNRVIGQQAVVMAVQNGVSDKGYPNVNRNFIDREHVAAKQAEIAKNGKMPFGPLGKDGRKDGGVGAQQGLPGLPAGAAPVFGSMPVAPGGGAPAFTAPPPAFGAQPATNGAPPPGFAAPPNLDALAGSGQLTLKA